MKNSLVILPTYNEKLNIYEIVHELITTGFDVLVVDDNSPDKTYEIVSKISLINSKVNLIKRHAKLGLGSAYREGFSWAMNRGYDFIIEMDADFSHRIEDLKFLYNKKSDDTLLIGSRYITNASIVGWSKKRILLSKYANILARKVTKLNVNDLTSGFRIYPKNILENVNFNLSKSNGYAFQIELTVMVSKANYNIQEVPITFVERKHGKSKLNKRVILEALKYLVFFRFKT